jgi:hypothetical protein
MAAILPPAILISAAMVPAVPGLTTCTFLKSDQTCVLIYALMIFC